MPRPSARARAYGTIEPSTRQASARTAVGRWSPSAVNHSRSPPKIAASPNRSSVESRNAPQSLLRPERRAMTPSSESVRAKTRDDEGPGEQVPGRVERQGRHDDGERAGDRHRVRGHPAGEEQVGERGHDLRHGAAQSVQHRSIIPRPSSADGHAAASRARVSPSSSGRALVRPTIGRKFASPPHRGHHVLVQVRRDARAGDRALVHAEVEPVRRRDAARSTRMAVWVRVATSTVSSGVRSV